jgi:hypothetical protein
MASQPQPTTTSQTTPTITPIDSSALIEHGNSPTAIIITLTFLIAVLFTSMTALIRVLLLVVMHLPKSSLHSRQRTFHRNSRSNYPNR